MKVATEGDLLLTLSPTSYLLGAGWDRCCQVVTCSTPGPELNTYFHGRNKMLTSKQESFCKLIIEGNTQIDAYKGAYNAESMAANTISRKASLLASKGYIRARIAELCAEITKDWIWERQNSVRVLAAIALRKENAPKDQISAVKELNNMYGFNAPVKQAHSFTGKDGKPLSFTVRTIYVSPGEVER